METPHRVEKDRHSAEHQVEEAHHLEDIQEGEAEEDPSMDILSLEEDNCPKPTTARS